MASSPPGVEVLSTINQRRVVLDRMSEEPVDKQTIGDEFGFAGTTIDEMVRELRENELIASASSGFRTTLFGDLLNEVYQTFDQHLIALATGGDGPPLWNTAADRQEAIRLISARIDILEYVKTPHDKRDLVAALDVSRSTIDRALRELETAQLITWTPGSYTTTAIGAKAATQYRNTIDAINDILSARDVLTVLPPDCQLRPTVLTDSAVEYSRETPPYHLPAGVRERIVVADHVRLYLPVLATPQLLDCCQRQVIHKGLTLDLLTSPSLFETLSADFPGPLGTMAASDRCTGSIVDTTAGKQLPFGLLLAKSDETTTISVITYSEQRTVHGVIHNDSANAVQWAERQYKRLHEKTTDVTDELRSLTPYENETIALRDVDQFALEREGFVQLTPSYFAQRSPAPPLTSWRTGFDLVDVHAGYVMDRGTMSDGTRQNLTHHFTERLTTGENLVVLGAPGSGKSTICKSIACRWYEQGFGPVFYRRSGHGMTMPSTSVLRKQLQSIDGQALVVVEDAVRAEANAIFQLMQAFRGTDSVTFLLDSRKAEWDDPKELPIDAGLEAYRHEDIEVVTVPTFDNREAKRLIKRFQQTTGHDFDDAIVSQLYADTFTDTETQKQNYSPPSTDPGALLLFLHRLVFAAEPLVVYDTKTPTSFIEDVQRTYNDLKKEADALVFDVCVFVNILNAAGIVVTPAIICALATREDSIEVNEILDALSSLEGRILFPRDETVSRSTTYQVVHEQWSILFLDYLLSVEGDRTASQWFGRCVTALLSLADNKDQRDRLLTVAGEDATAIEQIEAGPSEWADTIVEQLYGIGMRHRDLAPLFGITETSFIDLPTACSQRIAVKCSLWRIKMLLEAGDLTNAELECEALGELIDEIVETDPEWTATLRGRRLNGLGIIAWHRGEYDTAKQRWNDAIAHYDEAGNRQRLAQTYGHLGGVAYYHGDTETAKTAFLQNLETFREIGSSPNEVSALNNLGLVYRRLGEVTTAIDYYQQSLEIASKASTPRDEASSLVSLGITVAHHDSLENGEAYCIQGLELAREAGIEIWLAEGLEQLSRISWLRGDLVTAEQYAKQSLDTRQQFNSERVEAKSHLIRGLIARDRGILDTAFEHCTTSHESFQDSGDRIFEARSLTALGTVSHEQGSFDTAEEHAKDSLTQHQTIGNVRGEARCYRLLGQIAQDRERFTTAEEYLTQALAAFREADYRCEQAKTLTALGTLDHCRGEIDHARERFEAAIELSHNTEMVRNAIETTEQLVTVCETQGDLDSALRHCERGYDLAQQTEFIESSLDKQRERLTEQTSDDGTC